LRRQIPKVFAELAVNSGPLVLTGVPGGFNKSNPDIHSFILDPAIQSGQIPVKRLRIICESHRQRRLSCSLLRTTADSIHGPAYRRSQLRAGTVWVNGYMETEDMNFPFGASRNRATGATTRGSRRRSTRRCSRR